ncbi:MAG TPA: hemolysin family protein [Streptosporangiaceae bacterium]|nr:hemolysin family protein [Streptosporangiaceae bacterium]
MNVGWDILLVLAVIFIGGFFAAAEMALVSLREGQVRSLGRQGRRGQRAARLAQDPNRFLASVQIGVTLATLMSGAFGAALLADKLANRLASLGLSGSVATPLSIVVVTLVISFFTLILGELAPKRIALQRAERVSLFAAPVVDRLATLARPLVWLLSRCTNLVVRLLGGDPAAARGLMTDEELRDLVAGHQALSPDERHIVGEVFDAGKRQVREVLVPRTEVEFLPASMPIADAAAMAEQARYSRFPVYQESYDDVIGFVHARDLFDSRGGPDGRRVGEVCRPVKFLPISKMVLSALSEMRKDRAHLAIVVDEYGGTAGIVTLEDLVEELIGDIQDEYDEEASHPRQLHGGELEVDGLLNLDEFAEQTGLELPEGPYETVAGYLLAALGHLPADGESAEVGGRKLTVTQMDGRRIARLRVSPAPAAAEEPPQAG